MTWDEVFEIEETDLWGRIGKLYTAHGVIRTPTLAPVINPAKSVLPPKEIEEMGFGVLMTNSYIIKQSYGEIALEMGVHKLLGVEGPVMTDSGAYQLLVYGRVKTSPREILEYQIKLGSDIGVILDIPTRRNVSKHVVEKEVKETIRRAEEAVKVDREKMLLVGPVQGGLFLDIVSNAARRLSQLPFDIYAVGGPTQIMENYRFNELVRLVMTAKLNLPWSAPLHLFGAGHPMLIPLAVAMGVDLFDSASYVLYARDDRYLTERGTVRLRELEYLPCVCPVCSNLTADELKAMPKQERIVSLTKHNLYVLKKEILRARQAIYEGRLWELIEEKTRTHPAMADALCEYRKYVAFIERKHPVTRGVLQGIFFYGIESRWRPEVYRHLKRLKERFPPSSKKGIILIEETEQKPFTRFSQISTLVKYLREKDITNKAEIAIISAPFSIIPIELDGFYPLSQYEVNKDTIRGAWREIVSDIVWYILNREYKYTLIIYWSLPRYYIYRLKEALEQRGVRTVPMRVSYGDEKDVEKISEKVKMLVELIS